MVASTQHQALRRESPRVHPTAEIGKPSAGLLGPGDVRAAVSQVCEMLHQYIGAVWASPAVLGRFLPRLSPESAPHDGRVDAESAQDLRDLRGMSEGVRDVADVHAPPERSRGGSTEHEIADERLTADQECVG